MIIRGAFDTAAAATKVASTELDDDVKLEPAVEPAAGKTNDGKRKRVTKTEKISATSSSSSSVIAPYPSAVAAPPTLQEHVAMLTAALSFYHSHRRNCVGQSVRASRNAVKLHTTVLLVALDRTCNGFC